MIAFMGLLGPTLVKLASGLALILAGWGAWKAHGAIERRKGAELQRHNDRIEDEDTAVHIAAARLDAARADDIDRLLDEQSVEAARRLRRVVPGTPRERGRNDPR